MKKVIVLFVVLFTVFISSCNKNTKLNKYNVEFYVENKLVETQNIEEGKKINKPTDPILDGYVFNGWYIENEKWLFSSGTVTSDIKLTAKFDKIVPTEKIVPVYQGMEASHENVKTRKNQKNIKDEILPSIDVIETEGVDFFTSKGEKYLLSIHLYNPSSFEILSFTLNGKKYQSYEFKEGSNSTELIIELTAPNISGIKDLTIDAIKYIDGTEIKDVRMDGERTIHIGVQYEVIPTSTLINEEVSTNTYTARFDITDNANILNVENDLLVFLYDGTSIVEKLNLKLGMNVLEFKNLKMNQNYEYLIVGVYDKLDGKGKCARILYEGSFKTTHGIELTDIKSTKKDITFNILTIDTSAVINAIELYQNDVLVNSTKTNTTFINLLSNTEYKILLKYKYDFKGTEIYSQQEYLIKTNELTIPTINLDTLTANKKSINYLISKLDVDNTITSLNVLLYLNDNLINSNTKLTNELNNLLSNTTYKLVVNYEYNLNNGLGPVKEVITKEIKTLSLLSPKVEIITKVDLTTVNFNLFLTDPDNTAILNAVKVYKDEELIDSLEDLNERSFSNLIANVPYTLMVEYIYDLNDGSGVKTLISTKSFQTGKTTPKFSLTVRPSETKAEFTIKTTDPNATGHIESIKVYKEDLLIEEIENLSQRVIENLTNNTLYKLEVTYQYDLDDGNGTQELIEINEFKTTKVMPTIKFTSVETYDSANVNVKIDDVDLTGRLKEVKLLLDGVEIIKLDSIDDLTFNNLQSNTNYLLNLTYEYDLNDGVGIREAIFEYSFKTKEKKIPIVDMSVYPYEKTIKVNVGINDKDNVLIDKTIKCYNKEMLIAETKELTYEFVNLISNSIYDIVVIIEYDLNDGLGLRTISKSLEAVTSKVKPTVSINPLSITSSNIYFELIVSDNDAVCEIVSISLYKDKTLVQRVLDLQTRDFQKLESYSNYEIRVTYQYDLKDGNGTVGSTYSYLFNTAKLTPSIVFNEKTPLFEEYECDFIINDKEESGNITSLKLLYNNQIVREITSVTGTHINYLFKNLYSNSTYIIEATYTYDLCDLEGIRNTVFKHTFTTPKKEIPIVELDNVNVLYEEISFNYLVSNPDNALLYIKELAIIDSSKITYDTTLTTIKGLNSSKELTLYLVWGYNLTDSTGEHEIEISYDFETLTYIEPVVKIDNINTTYNTLEFNIKLDYHKDIDFNINSSLLYLDDKLVKEISNYESVYVDNLYAGRTYKYILEYSYNLHDGSGIKVVKFEREIKTQSYNNPNFFFNNLLVDNSSIGFTLSYEDVDNLIENIVSVTLYDGKRLVKSETLKDVYEYSSLYSNHNYRLVIEYNIDCKDGYGVVTKEYEYSFITKAKQLPVYEITNINSKTYSIGFNVNIKDSDNVSEIINYEIYNQGNLINTLNNGDNLLFENLNTGFKYLIRVNYKYDLQDGTGSHTSYVEKEVLTIDELIKVTAIDVLNEGYLTANEELHLRITIENPNELLITALKINETVINVTDAHVTNVVYIKLVPETKGGMYTISVNGLEYESQGLIVSQNISNPFSRIVNIVGKLEVLSFKPINDSPYFIDDVSYLIEIDNGSNFELSNIEVLLRKGTGDSATLNVVPKRIRANVYQIDINNEYYVLNIYEEIIIKNIYYKEIYYDINLTFTNSDIYNNETYKLRNVVFNTQADDMPFNGIKNISSADDFLNLSTTYECSILNITNDIDFTNKTLKTLSIFEGVILGNGYKIKNLSYIGDNFSGLFETFYGYAENLSIENIYVDTINHASGFAEKIILSELNDISIDGYIKGKQSASGISNYANQSIYYNVKNYATIEGSICAGITKEFMKNIAIKCSNYGTINATSEAGGLFYNASSIDADNSTYYISECSNYGNIFGSYYVGGLVTNLTKIQILNSANYGNITSKTYAAGLVAWFSNGQITNCLSICNLTNESLLTAGIVNVANIDSSYAFVKNSVYIGKVKSIESFDPIVHSISLSGLSQNQFKGDANNYFYSMFLDISMENSSWYNYKKSNMGTFKEVIDFNNSSFYQDVLGLDKTIWNYENIDIENGIYPTLR